METESFLQWKIRRMVVTLVRMLSGKRVVDGRIVDWPPFYNFATEAWQTNTSRHRIPMNHVFGNVIYPMHVRRHDTQNGVFGVTKIGNKPSAHVRRKHVRHNFAHSVSGKILKGACSALKCLKKKRRAELS